MTALPRHSDAAVFAAVVSYGPATRNELAKIVTDVFLPGDAYGGTGRALSRLHSLGLVRQADPVDDPFRWESNVTR